MTVSTDSNKSRAGREIRLGWLVAAIVALVIIADQWLKIWVKTHFYLGEDLELTSWLSRTTGLHSVWSGLTSMC